MLHQAIRILAFVVGALLFIGGLVPLAAGGADAFFGIWNIAIGAGIMIVAVLQRSGYKSEAAERGHTAADPGPGGGESGFVEPRFVPTTEVFIDPTSQHVMRVYEDPRTGERRYRAER
jgi:hypothetical protein